MTKLICPECQRENEAERIFCHGCGARLERSESATEKKASEKPEQTHRRVQQMFQPQRNRLREIFFKFAKLILAALLAAAVILMVSPVELAKPGQSIGMPNEISFELENAAHYHRPAQLRYTQEQVNAYLAYTLKGKQKSLDKSVLTFKRAVITFAEGTCAIVVERSLFGLSFYQSATYRVIANGKKVSGSNVGGAIGRMPVHPQVMRYLDIIFTDLWSALSRECNLLAKMTTIEPHDGYIVIMPSLPAQ